MKKRGGDWSGMVGELFAANADIAVAVIDNNDARREAVEFSIPLTTIR